MQRKYIEGVCRAYLAEAPQMWPANIVITEQDESNVSSGHQPHQILTCSCSPQVSKSSNMHSSIGISTLTLCPAPGQTALYGVVEKKNTVPLRQKIASNQT